MTITNDFPSRFIIYSLINKFSRYNKERSFFLNRHHAFWSNLEFFMNSFWNQYKFVFLHYVNMLACRKRQNMINNLQFTISVLTRINRNGKINTFVNYNSRYLPCSIDFSINSNKINLKHVFIQNKVFLYNLIILIDYVAPWCRSILINYRLWLLIILWIN